MMKSWWMFLVSVFCFLAAIGLLLYLQGTRSEINARYARFSSENAAIENLPVNAAEMDTLAGLVYLEVEEDVDVILRERRIFEIMMWVALVAAGAFWLASFRVPGQRCSHSIPVALCAAFLLLVCLH